MQIDRLSQLEKNLKSLRNQQHALEEEAILTTGLPKIQAEQRLEEQIKPKIREYEKEYLQVLAQQTKTVEIPEHEAEVIVAQIVEEVGQIEVQGQYPDEVVQILQEMRDKLNEPGPTAAAKLKGVISSIPPFVGISIEGEFDTENFLQQHFPTFWKWTKVFAKKS
jgi:predicted helicase